ncbi:MAG: oligopeptidase B, partial [Saprospiraceae bacterium]
MSLRDKQNIIAPIAEKNPTIHTKHGDVRIDDYYWMKLSDEQKVAETPDEHTSKVVSYLEAENKYREDMTSHLEGFQETLFEEIKGRIKQDDASVPYKSNGYYYITRYEAGQEYPIHSRKKDNLENAEEIMLDVNEMAKPYSYYNVSARKISIDNKILAYGE